MTTLADIEACARRWALTASEYPGLWAGYGYPPRFQIGGLSGSVVHLALETLTRELVRAGCHSVNDSAVVEVLQALGGITNVLRDAIDRVLARLKENPRAARMLESTKRTLHGQIPEMRIQVQSLLGRVHLPPTTCAQSRPGHSRARGPLWNGVYPELELRAKRIGWKGKADLLLLSDDRCEIVDFKTGSEADEHHLQLQIYALLWSLDEELNPARRLADTLTLIYGGRTVHVPAPTAAELAGLQESVVSRRERARLEAAKRPPTASPSCETCRFCSVRHLCDSYWLPETQRLLETEHGGSEASFADLEALITAQHGRVSWDASLQAMRSASKGTRVLLRCAEPIECVRPGARVRILGARVVIDDGEGGRSLVVTIGNMSEVYEVQ